MIKRFSTILSVLLASCHSTAPTAPAIDVKDAWARETAPGQLSGAVYLTIVNSGSEGDRLTGVSTPRAAGAMLHGSSENGGVMAMRTMGPIPIAGRATVTLAPLGMHIMLSRISAPLKVGERIPLTLSFAIAGKRQVDADVLAAGSSGPAR